ncbi:hypothetical protein BJ508DRAFT_64023 [Ascobolus immersus RN42]|uniref:von Willebrand and RING finger domain-containing protein n=1 Tax=Ascobolus immersus RN42 TaxID=1160509 RepID=A0A3N4ISM9_ASCIM|nr:hypothetical protein BJ508DRAFT_64023 [Ascobolus immersus RN42]
MTSFRSSSKNNYSKEEVPSNWYRLGLLTKKSKNRESTDFVGSSPAFNVDNSYSRDNTRSLRSRFGGLRTASSESNSLSDSYDYRSRTATPSSNIAPSFHSRSTGDRDLQTGSVTPRPFSNSDSRAPSSMAGMLDMDRARSRRDRTFVGSQCAVCDEPLEHTLRGERVIQFSCGHVSHEACFYEYIKEFDSQVCPECNAPLSLDTSRGGNVLDLEKISNIVRSVSVADSRSETPRQQDYHRGREEIQNQQNNQYQPHQSVQSHQSHQSHQSLQSHQGHQNHQNHQSHQSHQSHQQQYGYQDSHGGWETSTQNSGGIPARHGSRTSSLTRESQRGVDPRDQRDGRHDQLSTRGDSIRESSVSRQESHHWRNNSGASASDFAEQHASSGPVRRHDYDVQSMETDLSPRNSVANPTAPPVVTIKSEFPTITRSKQQQSLTCLVTVEVSERKWSSVLGPEPTDPLPPLPTNQPPMPSTLPVPYDGYPNDPPSPSGRSHRSYEKQDSQMSRDALDAITEDLRLRVENWHGLDFSRFGKLRLHGTIKVGKDCQSWQELECYLFSEMLICVKEKKISSNSAQYQGGQRKKMKCTLKGSILIKKHLKKVNDLTNGQHILTLSLSVNELPQFHLLFPNHSQLQHWQRALLDLHNVEVSPARRPQHDERNHTISDGEEDYNGKTTRRVSSINSSFGPRSAVTAPTDYSNSLRHIRVPAPVHSPLDVVVVIPVSSSMQGLKINLLRDALKFLVQNLGEKDRMGLVTFGSSGGGVPLVQMTGKSWPGWPKVIHSIRPVGPKSLRADVVEGANVAMDLLMQRKVRNPIASILLISDSSTSETEAVDFVVSRAEAAKISIHSFGLGLTHKPDNLIELSTRTKATYTYVKDWMMLRECVAGCIGSLQSLSHQNVKLKLKLPEGSPARFSKISGALHISKRASGREAEASLGDLRFGDKKDILVQLVITPDSTQPDDAPHDAWESIVSGLEALGGSMEQDESRSLSIEEVPLIQADLTFGDIQRDGSVTQLSRPHLLAITMLPPTPKKTKDSGRPPSPPIPPHPMIVQRRMELLTSDMLTRALTLVSRGQHDPAQTLLQETKTILRGLGKGGLPPIPSQANERSNPPSAPGSENGTNPTPPLERDFTPAGGIDPNTVSALLAELEAALEWIGHPAVFQRDSRKAVLQAIGVISSQRGNTFR